VLWQKRKITRLIAGIFGVALACLDVCAVDGQTLASPTPGAALTISGRVIDAQTGLPLTGATVSIESVGRSGGATPVASATSDARGAFAAANLAPGTYVLRVERLGYQPGASSQILLSDRDALGVTVALQAAATGGRLHEIGSTTSSADATLQRSSTIYRALSTEALEQDGVLRGADALTELPGVNPGNTGVTAGFASNVPLSIRGIGTLETLTTIDGHPLAEGFPLAYNFTVSPLAPFGNVLVTYGSGSNLSGASAIGGLVDLQTLAPTQAPRYTFSTGYGSFDAAATTLQATGTLGRIGYAAAYGVTAVDGPIKNDEMYQAGAAFDQSAVIPGASTAVRDLGIYKDDGTAVARSGLAKLRFALSPASSITFTTVAMSYWDDKTVNTDADYLDYAPALAFGNLLLSRYQPASYPKLAACPKGTFVATNAIGLPNGFGPGGVPDGGITCQSPAQYAAFNTGYAGAGPDWQAININDYHVGFASTARAQEIHVDAYTNRDFTTIDHAGALPYLTAPGDSPRANLVNWNEADTGVTASDTLHGGANDLGLGFTYLNQAYGLRVTFPSGASSTAPIVHTSGFLLHDVLHAPNSPLTTYGDLNFATSSATNTSYVDPRVSVVYAASTHDVIRAAAGATTTQPSGDELDLPFEPELPGAAGGFDSITCGGLNSVGTAPSSVLKPERGVDEEFAYGHRFQGDSLVQLTLYSENVYDKLYQTIVPLSTSGTAFINPTFLSQATAAVAGKCGAGAAQLLGVQGTFNVGQLRATGFMLGGRQRLGRHTFVDYDWTLDSTVLASAPAQLLRANLTLIEGGQLPRLPLHTLSVALDQTFGHGIDLRYTLYTVSANNPKSLPAYDYSNVRINVPAGPGLFSVAVANLFNQYANILGLQYEGVPLALNSYATAASYAPYTGASATERFGLPYRSVYFNYAIRTR
jgi:hypothetical protein